MTSAVGSTASTHQLASKTNKKSQLNTADFINMMVTQLQNQDPTDPVKNQDLLAQMSQIGQLQSTTALQDSLKNLVLQNSLGSAGNLIGKMVTGTDDNGESMDGLVNSVRVQDSSVYLELDTGKSLALDHVTAISPATASTSTSSTKSAKAA